jgi:hypothetical protein
MAFIITSDQEVPVSVKFVDDHDNPATVPAMPVWTSSNATVLSVAAAADGMSAVVVAVGPDGTGQISVSAMAGSITATLDIEVVSGAAVAAVVTPGTPVLNIWASGP